MYNTHLNLPYKDFIINTSEFIEKANKIHKYAYDYSLVTYTNSKDKVYIICKTHGTFKQTPNNHLMGQKCAKCVGGVQSNTDSFTIKAKAIHGDTYGYSKVKYVNSTTKILIDCKIHGTFSQTPNNHLSGKGCKYCGGTSLKSKDIFIADATRIHGDTYDYRHVSDTKYYTKIPIECKIHGVFTQQVGSHLLGSGCPKCALHGFSTSIPAILYYLKVLHEGNLYYKIGVTNRTINERYTVTDKNKILETKCFKFKTGKLASITEKIIVKRNNVHLYKGSDIILESAKGNQELFEKDILNIFN